MKARKESVKDMHLRHRQEYRDMTDRQDGEIAAAVRAEFPIGTSVRYKHGQNYITAFVDSFLPHSWCGSKVIAKNAKTGNKKEIEAHELEHAVP